MPKLKTKDDNLENKNKYMTADLVLFKCYYTIINLV